MYRKLFKNFVSRNKKLFFLMLFSLMISLSGYIFSDSLTQNFLETIESDARENLGGDFVIDIGQSSEDVFEKFYEEFPYKKNVELAKELSIYSSVKVGKEYLPANIIFHSENYPFYKSFENIVTNKAGEVFVSEDFYAKEKKFVSLLGEKFTIKGYYKAEVAGGVSSLLGGESFFLGSSSFAKLPINDTNSLIEKKYYLRLKEAVDFEKIFGYLESVKKDFSDMRTRDYKSGGERFGDIVSNLRSYINIIVLFSFLLTATIIFIAISSFFITERKSMSILKILGFQNKNLFYFITLLFLSLLVFSLGIGLLLNLVSFHFLQNVESMVGFHIFWGSVLKATAIGGLIITASILFPLIKFIFFQANEGLSEDFFGHFSKKELFLLVGICLVLTFILLVFLGYGVFSSIIVPFGIITFLFFFSIVLSFVINMVQKFKGIFRRKCFFIFDSLRVLNAPGNMSFLIGMSFFIVFSVGFSLLLLFGNFNERLQINLQTDKNFFALNITPEVYKKLSPEYKEESFSLIKGRILEINSTSLEEHLGGKASGRFKREFNITDNSLSDLKILDGKEIEENGVSVDYDFSQEIGVKIGDTITFSIFGLEKQLTVLNIRESQDRSINPFFYFQVDREEFEKYPKQYFLSSFVEKEDIERTKQYFYEISNGTVNFIEVEKILQELKSISTKVVLILQSLFFYIALFCLLSVGVVMLFFSYQQKKSDYLYTLLGTSILQNRIKNFSNYLFLASISFVLCLVFISPVFYYFLSTNSFISFSWEIYFLSLGVLLGSYLLLLLGIWITLGKNIDT